MGAPAAAALGSVARLLPLPRPLPAALHPPSPAKPRLFLCPSAPPCSSYVQQRDVLMAAATVREAITTAALLKLPRRMPAAEKRARVDGVLAELDLEGCQVGGWCWCC